MWYRYWTSALYSSLEINVWFVLKVLTPFFHFLKFQPHSPSGVRPSTAPRSRRDGEYGESTEYIKYIISVLQL